MPIHVIAKGVSAVVMMITLKLHKKDWHQLRPLAIANNNSLKSSKQRLQSRRRKRLRKEKEKERKKIQIMMIRNPTIKTMTKMKTKLIVTTLKATRISHLTFKPILKTSDAH